MGALTRVLAGRLAQAVMVALLVGIASFAIVEMLPGDQAFRIAAARYGEDMASARAAATVRAELGLDRPWPARLAVWLGQIATLDLGVSLVSGEDVIEELSLQLGATVGLSLLALGLSALVGVPLGIAMAMRGGALDAAGLVVAAALRATPAYLIGLGLMLLIAVQWGLLPAAGYDSAAAWPLPAATLAIGLAAMSMRVTREAAARVLARADTHFARTKGLAEGAVLRRHVLRNAAVPVVAYMGVQLVWLVEGVVVVESLFAWPGIGHALVHAVVARDVPMIQGTALAMGLIFVALNAAVDALCLALDPRGRRE
ncbi:MAG: ABC transporter permease [Alphaproteobacteria bacterium]|nr:ABC transporter permease [Alphaproteobacteria bacterium]